MQTLEKLHYIQKKKEDKIIKYFCIGSPISMLLTTAYTCIANWLKVVSCIKMIIGTADFISIPVCDQFCSTGARTTCGAIRHCSTIKLEAN